MKISKKPLAAALVAGALGFLIPRGEQVEAASTLRPVKPADLKRAIAAERGKVVLVNFWATWCPPCVAELPALAKLQQANAKKGFKLILVSGDDPSESASVRKTLQAKGHNGQSYIINSDLGDFFNGFDPKDKSTIALPRTYIYDRTGKQVKMVSEDHTQAEYQRMIQPYLGKR